MVREGCREITRVRRSAGRFRCIWQNTFDAESRTSKSKANFVIFSLATKNSWKDRETGEWESRTEWHRAIAFGRPATLAATLLKGDHVQIQGQLRTREFEKLADKNGTGKQRLTEIHVTSILKLDRSAKQNAGQPEVEWVA